MNVRHHFAQYKTTINTLTIYTVTVRLIYFTYKSRAEIKGRLASLIEENN